MNNGILMIAFGERFDRMAAKAIAHSQRYTNLPFTVLTNIEKKCKEWDKTKNVNFVYIKDTDGKNRQYKTTMINYSPYDNTIYMDADSVIQKKGIEQAFNLLDQNDIMLNVYGNWINRVPLSYYRITFDKLKIKIPITIYYGAFIGFSKTDTAKNFFKKWNCNWKMSGIAREMPALASTVKQFGNTLKLKRLNNTNKIFTWRRQEDFVVQHEYGAAFWKKFGLR